MKLKNISCTQFAGICDRSIALEDGLNVICGQNESGKSTLVNLVSRTLFQKAKLDKRSVSGKEFEQLYFPSVKKGSSIQGDFANGKVTFEAGKGTYTLEKEWSNDSRVILHTPDGILRNAPKIDEALRQVLIYGEGVYSSMLLLAQNNMDESLKTLLDASKKSDAKQEIVDVASKAFAESDGVSMDVLEAKIEDEIDKLIGKHWNEAKGVPLPCKENRWTNSKGDILTAYYEAEDAKQDLDKINDLSSKVDTAAFRYIEKAAQVAAAEDQYKCFDKFYKRLNEEKHNRDKMHELQSKYKSYKTDMDRWPQAKAEVKKAEALKNEQANRKVLDQYNNAKDAHDELSKVDQSLVNRPCPTTKEIEEVQKADCDITRLENQLRGMNLNAVVHMLDGHNVGITTVRNGENLPLNGETAALTEAVRITIPGVMEMELAPANVDVAAITHDIAEAQEKRAHVLEDYEVDDLAALEKLKDRIETEKKKDEKQRDKLNGILQGADFEVLQNQANTILSVSSSIRSALEIQRDIYQLCDDTDLIYFLGEVGGELKAFQKNYTDLENLRNRLECVSGELKNLKNSVSLEDIPAEYRDITDPEGYQEELNDDIKNAQKAKEIALSERTKAETTLENYHEKIIGDPKEKLDQAELHFKELLEELHHWRHIQKVFQAQKAELHNNPTEDIARNFAHYLGVISSGRVTSEFPKEDKLQINIYSNDFQLDHKQLSEGTKETVALAFRLAVLDHLFPEGGGLAIFDDPFTDMDAERTRQSCALLKDAAQRHQIIVLTCREEYIPLLGGHAIHI